MEFMKRGWQKTPGRVRQTLVFIIGWLIIIAGIIMLVTPGPGWATIFLGFTVLATEFTSANKTKQWLVKKLKEIIAWLQKTFLPKKRS